MRHGLKSDPNYFDRVVIKPWKGILGYGILKNEYMFVAQRFLLTVIKDYGKRPVLTEIETLEFFASLPVFENGSPYPSLF